MARKKLLRTTQFRFFTSLFSCRLRRDNFKLNVSQEKGSFSICSRSNATMIFGDEDVDYTAPKTPSSHLQWTSKNTWRRTNKTMLTKTKPAVTSHSPQAHFPFSIPCTSLPIFRFSPCNRKPRNFKTALCADAVM